MKRTKKAIASLAIAGMALTAIPFNALAADMSTRLGGYTAAQTAVQIADETGWSGTAILASSASYGMVDALTAGPLAAYLKAPILLQEAGNVLNPDTKAELTKLNVKTVYVTSGTAVISQAVLDELKGMGITVISLGGADRFETSVNIAKEMLTLGASISKVAVAYGWLNQDALSIASIASAQTEPILLTDKDSIPASVKEFLAANSGVTATDVIGGTGVISDSVQNQFPNPSRQYGYTAYDTNLAVLKAFDSVLKYDRVFVANGETAIDALAGAPLAAKYKAGIVLTKGTVNAATEYVNGKLTAASVITALGGTAVVPEAVRSSMVYVPPVVPVEPTKPTKPGSGGGGGGGGGGGDTVTTATVSNAGELTTALNNTNIKTITFNKDIISNINIAGNIARTLTIDFGTHVLTGNVTFEHMLSGTSKLMGSAPHSIVGNLTVNTPNASFINQVAVDGNVNIADVEPGTWTESANGNVLTITDSTGSTINITGSPGSITVSETAGGVLSITIKAGATVSSIVCNAPVALKVEQNAKVDDLVVGPTAGGSSITNNGTTKNVTVEAGANGTTIANNGAMAKLTTDANIRLNATVAPGSTTYGAGATIDTSGSTAQVPTTSLVTLINAINSADSNTIIAALQALAAVAPLDADKIIAAYAEAYVADFASHDTNTVSQIRVRIDAVNAAQALKAPKIIGTSITGADLTDNTLSFSFANLKKDSTISVSKDAKMSLSLAKSGVIGDFNLKAGSNSLLSVPLPNNEDLNLSQANMTAIFNAIKDLNSTDKEAILNTVDFGKVLQLVQQADSTTQNAVFEQMGFEDFYAGIRNADAALKSKILENIGAVIDESLKDSNAGDYKNHVIFALLPSLDKLDPELTSDQMDTLKEFYRSEINMSELLKNLKLSAAQKEALINNVDYAKLFKVMMTDLTPQTRAKMFETINFTNLFEAMKTATEAQKAQIYENIFNTMDVVVDSTVSRTDLLDALVFGADKKDAIFQILKNLDNTTGEVTLTVTLTDAASHTTTYTFVISK